MPKVDNRPFWSPWLFSGDAEIFTALCCRERTPLDTSGFFFCVTNGFWSNHFFANGLPFTALHCLFAEKIFLKKALCKKKYKDDSRKFFHSAGKFHTQV
jgi:hypothetical protein